MELYIKIYDAPKCAGGAVTQDWYFSEQQGRPVWKGTLEPRPPWPKGASLARWGKRPPRSRPDSRPQVWLYRGRGPRKDAVGPVLRAGALSGVTVASRGVARLAASQGHQGALERGQNLNRRWS